MSNHSCFWQILMLCENCTYCLHFWKCSEASRTAQGFMSLSLEKLAGVLASQHRCFRAQLQLVVKCFVCGNTCIKNPTTIWLAFHGCTAAFLRRVLVSQHTALVSLLIGRRQANACTAKALLQCCCRYSTSWRVSVAHPLMALCMPSPPFNCLRVHSRRPRKLARLENGSTARRCWKTLVLSLYLAMVLVKEKAHITSEQQFCQQKTRLKAYATGCETTTRSFCPSTATSHTCCSCNSCNNFAG